MPYFQAYSTTLLPIIPLYLCIAIVEGVMKRL
jgi:hypothetical protein